MKSFPELELNPEMIKRHIAKWERSEQAIFMAVFIQKKPRKEIAHDLGIPFSLLEGKIEELVRRFRYAPT